MPLYSPPTALRGDPVYGSDARDFGLLAMTFDPLLINGGLVATTGLQYFQKVWIPRTILATNVVFYVQTIGATLTVGANNLGLYNSAGTQIAATADQTTNYTTTGLRTVPFTTPVTVVGGPGVFVWVGWKSSGTTPVTMSRCALPAAAASLNMNLAVATSRSCTNGTSATTLMPASFTPSTNSPTAQPYWFGIS